MGSVKLPNLTLIQAFKAVAETRNFSRAADSLGLTQSAVSQQILKLESMVGAPLFSRTTRQLELTEEGMSLLSEITFPLASLIQTFENFSRPNKIPVLHIECEPVLSAVWLAPRLKRFMEAHGSFYIQQKLTTQQLEFSSDTQVAIKWGTDKRPGFNSEYLMGLNYIPVCSPALLAEVGSMSPSQLGSLPLLHDRDKQDWKGWLAYFDVLDVIPNDGHVVNDANVLMNMAIEGHGVALCAIELCERPLREGLLVMPFPGMSMPHQFAYYIFTRITPMRTDKASLFIEWLKEEARTS